MITVTCVEERGGNGYDYCDCHFGGRKGVLLILGAYGRVCERRGGRSGGAVILEGERIGMCVMMVMTTP